MISHFLGYVVPWYFWIIPGAAASAATFFILWRFLGLRGAAFSAAAVVALSTLLTFSRKERQRGWDAKAEKDRKDGEKLVQRADRAGRVVLNAPAERLRDDDGFKRGE